jgi:hypothetical protein
VENSGFPLCRETWGFHFDRIYGFPFVTKLGVSNRIMRGMSSGRHLNIKYVVDVTRDNNDLRQGRM